MGKRIIQQARGHGSLSYRVRAKAFVIKLKYPNMNVEGEAEVIKLVHSAAHSAPLAKIKLGKHVFFNPANEGMYEGQKVILGQAKQKGDIAKLKDIPVSMSIYNIENEPGDGGKLVRTAGSSAIIFKKEKNKIIVLMPSKKEKEFNENCRATLGIIAGAGRLEKPIMKAGKMFYIKKTRNKLWPRTSAVKMNVVDHPFGSGRGKRIKSKIAKRNAPPGARVGLLRPKRTGRSKR